MIAAITLPTKHALIVKGARAVALEEATLRVAVCLRCDKLRSERQGLYKCGMSGHKVLTDISYPSEAPRQFVRRGA